MRMSTATFRGIPRRTGGRRAACPRTTHPAPLQTSVHGLKVGTPVGAKSATFRVATLIL